jgi:stage V sporulation protein D (sporulation-specific penicillin-binding protein)
MKKRLYVIAAVMLIIPVFITASMYKVGVRDSAQYQAMANETQFGSTIVNANRGAIYDVNGKILAQSATVYNVVLDPLLLLEVEGEEEQVRQQAVIAAVLSDELPDISISDIDNLFTKYADKHWASVAKKIEKPVVDKILNRLAEEKVKTGIVYTETDTKRYYPQGELAAAVIGFTNYEGDGVYGIEKFYDDFLKGVDGKIVSAQDANGNIMPYKNDKIYDAQDGNSIYLTLDMTLQSYAEKYLEEQVITNQARNRGCAIMMNCKTGEILAMATTPGFDLNDRNAIFSAADEQKLALTLSDEEYEEQYAILREQQWKNKAITETYYPGSVFKVVTCSAALEEKVINLNSTFNCGGSLIVGDHKFHCWSSRVHGSQDLITAMTNSCNPAFISIGLRLGAPNFSRYFTAYGLNQKTGIDLPGEVNSINIDVTDYGQVELASSAFGQTNKITPIQMITAYAATINGGYLVTPHVASHIVDKNGNIIKSYGTQVRRQVISEETSETMRQILEDVVNNKNGSNAYIKGYAIGGKSGTSQKQDENNAQNREDLYVSSYVGFAPADDPEIICLVMVDEPMAKDQNGGQVYYGSLIAAPAVSNILRDSLPYLGYYPEYTEEELAAMGVVVPSVEGQIAETAKKTLTELGMQVELVGDGSTVISQVPPAASSIPHNGKVILYTEEGEKEIFTEVPSLMGKTPAECNKLLTDANLNLKLGDGASANPNSAASMQNYEAGAIVPAGTIIEVYFVVKDEG